jgi:hypothetical protein
MSERFYRFVLRGFNIKKYWEEEPSAEEPMLIDDDEISVENFGGEAGSEESQLKYDTETLKHNESDKYIRYMGSNSDKHKLWLIDYDLVKQTTMPTQTERRCDHDHHTFSNNPIGCPMHYINLEDNSLRVQTIFDKLKLKNLKFPPKSEIFITQKVFCSMNCLYTFIQEKRKTDIYYEKSITLFTLLLQKMEKIYGKNLQVTATPPLETLICYGGHLTIDEFRNVNGRLIYELSRDIQTPLFFPAGEIIEEMMGNKMMRD